MFDLHKQLKNKKIIIEIIIVLVLTGLIFYLLPVEEIQAQLWADPTLSFLWSDDTASGPIDTDTAERGIARFLTWIVVAFVTVIGKLLMIFISVVVGVAQYNEFVDSKAVSIGWTMVRDIANIFFVIIILIIAFGTLFKVQTYEYKKLLPKLVIAAILVNFSKMIVGAAIDVGQVIMLTFVHAFKGVAAGAVVNGLGLELMLELGDTLENVGASVNHWSIFGAAVLALIMLIIACVTVLALVVVLLFRIIMLWILVIFSPFAFIASVIPTSPLQKVGFFGQYWSYLSKYIIVGPILAFFLWLSFSILMQLNRESEQHIITLHRSQYAVTQGTGSEESQQQYVEYLASKISSPQAIFDYMVTIALLIGSLVVTQQMGVMGGNFGMNAVNKIKTASGKWSKDRLVGLGQRLDRTSVRAQKALGFQRPVTLRPSIRKQAKDMYKQRVEDKVYKEGGVVGGMVDRLNKMKTFRRDKTDFQGLEKARYVAEKKKEIEEGPGGNDENALNERLKKATKKADKEAIMYKLTELHGINTAAGGGTAEHIDDLVEKHFGTGNEANRIRTKISEIGMMNKDPQFWGSTYVDKDGKYKRQELKEGDLDLDKAKNKKLTEHMIKRFNYLKAKDDRFRDVENFEDLMKPENKTAQEVMLEEKRAKLASEMQAKKSGTNAISTLTRDAFTVDEKGRLAPGAKQMLLENAQQLSASFIRGVSPELSEDLRNKVTAIKEYADDDKEVKDPEERRKLYKVIGRIINPEGKGEELFEDAKIGEMQDRDKANRTIEQYLSGDKGVEYEEINHEEEITKKTTIIEENEKKIKNLREEVLKEEVDYKERRGNLTNEGLAEKEESINKKKEQIGKLEEESSRVRQEIHVTHQSGVADKAVGELNKDAFRDPKEMEEAGQRLAAAIDEVTKSIGDKRMDFSKPNNEMNGFMNKLNKLNKEIKGLGSGYKQPDLSFASPENITKVEDPELQKGILQQLRTISIKLSKKAKPEAGSAGPETV